MTIETPSARPGRRTFLVTALLLGSYARAAVTTAAAAEPAPATSQAAEQLIRTTVATVFAILRDAELAKDRQRRMQRLREAADLAFDWVTMSMSCLGHHWRKLTEAERSAFVAVFKELLAQRYMEDIDRFRGTEEVIVRGAQKVEDLYLVKTLLVTSSREQVPMDYTLQDVAAGLRVVDLSVEGISLVNHYRSTFSRFLVNRSFSELLAQLKQKLGMS